MKPQKKPRIFIGIVEITGYTSQLADGLRKFGFNVTHILIKPRIIPAHLRGYKRPDRYIEYSDKWLKYFFNFIREFLRVFHDHDIFIFNFSEGFFSLCFPPWLPPIIRDKFPKYIDWQILKFLGKTIVVVAHGCDIRHYLPAEREARRLGLKYWLCMDCVLKHKCRLAVKMYRVKMIERYADYIFSYHTAAQLLSRKFKQLWLPIKLDSIKYEVHKSPEPLIIHAPTDPALKGTKYIVDAINRLRNENYKFNFLLCKGMNHDEFVKKLTGSEIVIDQLIERMGYCTMLILEAMATGNMVLSSAVPGLYGLPRDIPVLTTTPDTIYKNLKLALDNPELRVEYAKKGREAVEKYHDYIKVATRFLTDIGVL